MERLKHPRVFETITALSALALLGSIAWAKYNNDQAGQEPVIWIGGGANMETPAQVLDNELNNLNNGGTVEVTDANVEIPGAIGETVGRPIVFRAGSREYFAYIQRGDQIITSENVVMILEPPKDHNVPLTEAHENKSGILVDSNELEVGYAIGSGGGGK